MHVLEIVFEIVLVLVVYVYSVVSRRQHNKVIRKYSQRFCLGISRATSPPGQICCVANSFPLAVEWGEGLGCDVELYLASDDGVDLVWFLCLRQHVIAVSLCFAL